MATMRLRACQAFALALLLPGGCQRARTQQPLPVEPAPVVADAERAAAQRFYDQRCLSCHGPTGHADGPQAKTTVPRPQNLTDRMWQSNVSNQRLRKVLVYGGAAVGKSAAMPGSPELAKQPALLDALVAVVRGLAASQ